jgi:hypothetical protein
MPIAASICVMELVLVFSVLTGEILKRRGLAVSCFSQFLLDFFFSLKYGSARSVLEVPETCDGDVEEECGW